MYITYPVWEERDRKKTTFISKGKRKRTNQEINYDCTNATRAEICSHNTNRPKNKEVENVSTIFDESH